jgi:hypothetical protein
MRSDGARAVATFFAWLMGGGVAIAALMQGMFIGGGAVVFVVLIALIAAMGSTRFIWGDTVESQAEEPEKGKRRGRIDRLIDGLNEEEREVLLTRLTENDGEVSLDEVMRR